MAARADIGAAAAVPIAHPILGEALCLYVEAAAGATPTAAQLRAHAQAHLPPEARPAQIRLLHALPRTGSDKPDLAALTAMAQGRRST